MRAALGWLEREAIRVRRGSHNQAWLARPRRRTGRRGPRRLATSGVVAASFRHRTSRAGDPLLHWHVLVANLAEGADGRWSAFVHPELYRHARAAGEVFQAAFRDELTASLGVEWRPGRHVPEIAGIPQRSSTRSRSAPTRSRPGWPQPAHPTRPQGARRRCWPPGATSPKSKHGRFDAGWKAEAEAAGWGPDAAERLVGWSPQRSRVDDRRRVAARRGRLRRARPRRALRADRRARRNGSPTCSARDLTATASTFTEADLVQAVAARQGRARRSRRSSGSPVASSPPTRSSPSPPPTTEPAPVDQPGAARRRGPLPRRRHRSARASTAARRRRSRRAVAGRPSLGADQLAAVRTVSPTSASGGGAGRPGRHRQDLHARRRPRRLRARRPLGHRRRAVGPGRASS